MAGEADIALLRLTGERRITPEARRSGSSLCHPALCKLVASKLSEDWSPEHIAGSQKLGSLDHTCRVPHETIYQTLFIQTRGARKRELLSHVRRDGSVRRPQVAKERACRQGQIRDPVSIRERPPAAEDRAVPGHRGGGPAYGAAPRGPRGPRGRRRPRIGTPPSAGTWIARMRAASETRNLLLCPTDQATGHSYSTSGCAIVCIPAY